ncbi:MAG: AI-2E family transporter [Bryobacterales bacterium]|nr:AI-2E family transporter [Bryobacterales bacterium]
MQERGPSIWNTLMAMAAIVVVAAGIKLAAIIVTPFFLSVFLAILAGPPVFWLHRHRVPRGLAILIVILGIGGVIALVGTLAAASLSDFAASLPGNQARLQGQWEQALASLEGWLDEFGIQHIPESVWDQSDLGRLVGTAAQFAGATLLQFGNLVSKVVLAVLTVTLMLLEAFQLPKKVQPLLTQSGRTWEHFEAFARSVHKYIAIKTLASLLTGFAITLWVWMWGIEYAIFWGLLGFLLNFIPNIGSLLAAIPAVLMAIVQYGGGTALIVALGYFAINFIIGGVIEPQFMADGVGLSPIVVFMSLVVWGFLLGPVGMLLSTPLTISVKIALQGYRDASWIATLIGSGKT